MASRMIGALMTALLAYFYAAAALSEPLQILYAEPFQLQFMQTPGAQKTGPDILRIQAFGGTFELMLEDNSSLLRYAPPQIRSRLSTTQLFKGALRNLPGSWVRLTATDGVYSGAIWDGSELYAIEPREVLDEALVTALPGAPGGSAIYRLSDTRGGALQGVCALDASAQPAVSSPLAKYRSLVQELQATGLAAAREIEVSMIADFEYTSQLGLPVTGRMINHVNVVDGIFSEQVGVAIVPTDFITFASDTDPFTSSNPSTLLDQVATYRQNTPAVRSRGLAHLLTGRQLNGNVIGVAFLGSLCVERQGVSLSESSSFIDTPLIMAHELGHNFGAPHDGEPDSACESTPPSFLMGPFLNDNGQFSACSLQQMQPVIDAAACVVPARNRDVAVSVLQDTIVATPGQEFDFIADVASTGSSAAANVLVNVALPPGLQRVSVTATDLDCRFTTQGVACEKSELAAGETRRLSVRLRGGGEGQFAVTANVSSTNDSNATNDSAVTQVTVAIARDFQITVAPQPITVVRGEPFEMTFDVASIASRTLNDVRVQISHSGSITTTAATIDGGTCTVTGSQPMAVCTLPSLAPGATRRMRATLVSNSVHSHNSPGVVQAFENGSSTGQRRVEFIVQTQAAHDLSVTTSSPVFQRIPIGAEAVWTFNVRSTGVHAIDNVTVRFQWIGASDVDVSIDPPIGPTCTRSFFSLLCSFGTLQPGETRPVTLRGRIDEEGDLRIDIFSDITQVDDRSDNDRMSVSIQARLGDDVQLQVPQPSSSAFEGRDQTLSALITAVGVNPSQNVVATATLPIGFFVQFVSIEGGTCSRQMATPHIATCSVQQLPPSERRSMDLRYTAGEPGTYTGTFSVSASADLDPANNSAPVTFTVAPDVDGALLGPPPQRLRTDVPVELPFTIASNKYALPDARVDFTWSQLADVTIVAPGATCADTATGHSCSFGTLAPNSSIPFIMRARGTAPPWAFLSVQLFSPGETNYGNNNIFYTLQVDAPGDAAIVIPQPVPDVTLGQRSEFAFNLDVSAAVNDVLLQLEFDPSRIASAFLGGGCQSTATGIRCDLGTTVLPQNSRLVLSFFPNVVGPTPITVRVLSANDANSANDVQTATITVIAPPAPPPPPPPPPVTPPASAGGGGGGGPMSWPMALALGLLAVTRRRLAGRAHHPS